MFGKEGYVVRPSTTNSYQERLNRVLIHIQKNLDEPLTIERLAEVACLSPFHFHRIFSAHVGETVTGYVRRLRLERAATRIAFTGESVTDTALGVGYETPAAFTRAFRERFGMSPSEFRGQQRETILSFAENSTAKEIIVMKPEMREFSKTKVLFVRRTGAYGEAATAAWEALMGFAYKNRLMTGETLMVGIGHDDPAITAEEKIRYDACVTFSGDVKPEGEVGIQTIAGGRYAVFLHKGAYTGLPEIYRNIFAGWLATSGCTLRDQPCFEVYLNRDPRRTKPENLRTEIWVPVV
ncbi:transcriptional regulator, AraC family [Geotalea uraniireducens Rf4]|uniref:Transcriptional regulator, AraC family n=2 Tax=Geotalea uraniireducens TaxID=351604 RepID=A5G790_GEOUR|nr:transcriptional regulator, AraC family [Geotalea uraniireducens Rf4]